MVVRLHFLSMFNSTLLWGFGDGCHILIPLRFSFVYFSDLQEFGFTRWKTKDSLEPMNLNLLYDLTEGKNGLASATHHAE